MSTRARRRSDAILATLAREIAGDVLAIGSHDDRDGAGRPYRSYFTAARSYTTSDIVPRPDCDRVLDVRRMPEVADGSYDCLVLAFVLEHVDDVGAAVAECARILRPGGVLLVGVPFQYRLHAVATDSDFWRFTEFGLRYLLRAWTVEALEAIGDDRAFPWTYLCRARKPQGREA